MIEKSNISDQRILAIVCLHNQKGKKDVTHAFLPEAKKLIKLGANGSVIVRVDNSKPFARRRREINRILNNYVEAGEHFDSIAVFCHGWADGIQIGYTRRTVWQFAESIAALTSNSSVATVPLYCCSTGDDKEDNSLAAAGTGDNSFADKLRDHMCKYDLTLCRVMAHTTVAHTTKNPMVLFMDGMGTPDGGVGGYPPVAPGSENWRAWKKALRDTNLRFRFPYMSVEHIHEELG